jgi:DNA-binding transcriptional LysR family regulator
MNKPPPSRLLNFHHLEGIHAIILTGSVTGAAERLNVTQPALSNRLRDAEERLGIELFERRAGRLVPNESALLLFEEIDRSLQGLEQVNEFCTRMLLERRKKMTIACTPVFGAAVLPKVLASFEMPTENIHYTIESRSANYVAALVASRKADVGFGLETTAMPGVSFEVIAELPMVCYLPPGHRLANAGVSVRAQDLVGELMIGLSKSEGVDQIVANAFQGAGFQPTQIAQCPAALIACGMVSAGLGFTIFDALPMQLLNPAMVTIRRFEPEIRLRYCAYWNSGRESNASIRKLIELAKVSFPKTCQS